MPLSAQLSVTSLTLMLVMMMMNCNSGVCLQVELQRAVQECSETEGGAEKDAGGGGGTTQTDGVHQRLFSILTRLLQEGGASREGSTSRQSRNQGHTALNF